MANHAQIQAAIDSYWATTLAPKVASVQATYAASHSGRFWQGIITPTTPPDDGALVNPDLGKKPTDQPEDWDDVFTGPNALPTTNWPNSLRIDVYNGPSGQGYVVVGVYTKGGETWGRSINIGPETYRDLPWIAVT
jgi:hypothetical protein